MMIFGFFLLLTFTTQQVATNCIDLPETEPFRLCAGLWKKTWETDIYGDPLNATNFALLRSIYASHGCDVDSSNFLRYLCSLFAPVCQEYNGSIDQIFPCRSLCLEFMREYKECYKNDMTLDCTKWPQPRDVNRICVPPAAI